MALDFALTAAQYLWQAHYISLYKVDLTIPNSREGGFGGALIAAALQSVRAFRVSGGDIFYLWYTFSGLWRTS